jgi:hypothetical protein
MKLIKDLLCELIKILIIIVDEKHLYTAQGQDQS